MARSVEARQWWCTRCKRVLENDGSAGSRRDTISALPVPKVRARDDHPRPRDGAVDRHRKIVVVHDGCEGLVAHSADLRAKS